VEIVRDGQKTVFKLLDIDKEEGFPVQKGNAPVRDRGPEVGQAVAKPEAKSDSNSSKDDTKSSSAVMSFILCPEFSHNLSGLDWLHSFMLVFPYAVFGYIVFDA